MSALDALSSSTTGNASSANAFGALNSDEFVKIIFTELANQDPMAPNDSQALLQQISTLRSIQSDMDMSDRIGSLVGQNEWTSAAGLIGKRISGLTLDASRIEGTVKSVSRTEIGPVLNLTTGERVPVSYVDEVLQSDPSTMPAVKP